MARKFAILLLCAICIASLSCQTVPSGCMTCPSYWSPICGIESDGSTSAFSSYCSMKRFNCINRTNFRLTSSKECAALNKGDLPTPPSNFNTLL